MKVKFDKFSRNFSIIAISFSILLAIILLLLITKSAPEILEIKENNLSKNNFQPESGCVSQIEEKTIQGDSLSGLIEPGQSVKILFNYYDCNEVEKEDIIVYNYAGNSEPLIKIVKGIPGDKFRLQKTDKDCWNILVNDKILRNSQNIPYCIDDSSYRMLFLYERDYNGIIPPNAYLILGNLPSGSLDSTRFGLIGKNDILGKAIK